MSLARLGRVLAICLVVGNTWPSLAQSAAPDEAALRALVAEIQAAINTKDLERYSRVVAPDVIAIEPDGEYRGRQALLDRFRQGMAGPPVRINAEPVQIRAVSPTLAIGVNRWDFVIGDLPPMHGSTFWTASKKDGKWVFEGWAVLPGAQPAMPIK